MGNTKVFTTRRIAALLVASLQRGPKSKTRIALDIGMEAKDTARFVKHLDELQDLGAVYVHHYEGVNRPWFAIQPGAPFGVPDAPSPVGKTKRNIDAFARKLYVYEGELKVLSDIAKKVGINKRTLYSRIHLKGYTLEEALFPVRGYKKIHEQSE